MASFSLRRFVSWAKERLKRLVLFRIAFARVRSMWNIIVPLQTKQRSYFRLNVCFSLIVDRVWLVFLCCPLFIQLAQLQHRRFFRIWELDEDYDFATISQTFQTMIIRKKSGKEYDQNWRRIQLYNSVAHNKMAKYQICKTANKKSTKKEGQRQSHVQ